MTTKNKKAINIYKCKDSKEKHYKKKGFLFDLPCRVLCVGKSQYSGKSSFLQNILNQDDNRLYKDDFDEIYIFSNSIKTDTKIKNIILNHDVPEENLFEDYSDEALEAIYEVTEENYQEAIDNKEKPPHVLLILDDVGFQLDKKNNSQLNRIFTMSRHINLSIFVCLQKYSQAQTTQRENATGLCLWSCSDKQLELISDDHNTLGDKKTFKKMFKTATENPFSYMVINYSNNKDERYLNMNFLPIGPCGRIKKEYGGDCPC